MDVKEKGGGAEGAEKEEVTDEGVGAEHRESETVLEGESVAGSLKNEELDLDQVKGRMLTMAGLFEIWTSDQVGSQ